MGDRTFSNGNQIAGALDERTNQLSYGAVPKSAHGSINVSVINTGGTCRENYCMERNSTVLSGSWDNISTNGTEYEEYILPHDSQIGFIIIYSFTIIFSIAGNAFVVLVFVRGRRSRTDLRPFLINLAIADLIMAVFCMPFSFTPVLLKTWIFSKPMCPLVLFMQFLSVVGSVFTNMAIGIDRFLAVMLPLRSRLTKDRAKYVIVAIWLCSFSLACVQLFVGRAVQYGDKVDCNEHWPTQESRRIYSLLVFTITYVIPLFILAITYAIVGILLWKRTTPGNAHQSRDRHQLRSKRKIIKMLVIVVAIFGVCWLPLHTFTLLLDFNPRLIIGKEKLFHYLYLCVHWLAMSNSFANPIIYSFTNESFRADLVTLFYMWFPCCVFLTKMIPRSPSSSTYESVVFRRNNFIKQGAKVQLLTSKNNRKFIKHVEDGDSEYIELRDNNSLRESFHSSSIRSNRGDTLQGNYTGSNPIAKRTREIGESMKLLTSPDKKMNGSPACSNTLDEFG